MTGKMLRAVPMAALALLMTSTGLLAADRSVPNWCGEFIGEYDILGIANCGKGQSFAFSLRNRAGPEVVLDGVAGLEKKNGRKGNGSGLDFSLSKGDGKITIRLQKEYQDRKESDDRYAGTYVRLDTAEVRDGALVAAGSGKVLSPPENPFSLVENSREALGDVLQFVPISPSTADGSLPPVRPGFYMVAVDGEVFYLDQTVSALTTGDGEAMPIGPEEFGDVSLASMSPDGKILAINLSYEAIGHWFFFSVPEIQAVEHPVVEAFASLADKSLLWNGSRKVVVDDMLSEDTSRTCGYDPCGPVSVVAYDLDTGESTVLKKGTDLCEYRALAVEGGEVKIGETCKASPEDWETYPDEPEKTISVALP